MEFPEGLGAEGVDAALVGTDFDEAGAAERPRILGGLALAEVEVAVESFAKSSNSPD